MLALFSEARGRLRNFDENLGNSHREKAVLPILLAVGMGIPFYLIYKPLRLVSRVLGVSYAGLYAIKTSFGLIRDILFHKYTQQQYIVDEEEGGEEIGVIADNSKQPTILDYFSHIAHQLSRSKRSINWNKFKEFPLTTICNLLGYILWFSIFAVISIPFLVLPKLIVLMFRSLGLNKIAMGSLIQSIFYGQRFTFNPPDAFSWERFKRSPVSMTCDFIGFVLMNVVLRAVLAVIIGAVQITYHAVRGTLSTIMGFCGLGFSPYHQGSRWYRYAVVRNSLGFDGEIQPDYVRSAYFPVRFFHALSFLSGRAFLYLGHHSVDEQVINAEERDYHFHRSYEAHLAAPVKVVSATSILVDEQASKAGTRLEQFIKNLS